MMNTNFRKRNLVANHDMENARRSVGKSLSKLKGAFCILRCLSDVALSFDKIAIHN